MRMTGNPCEGEARCPACPMATIGAPEDDPCPAHWDWPGFCGHIAREPGGGYWTNKLLQVAGFDAARSRFPAVLPPDGRIRAGLLMSSAYCGGAEIWGADLMAFTDPARVRWDGVAVKGFPGIPDAPNTVERWSRSAPVRFGDGAIAELGRRCDVLVSWGIRPEDAARLLPDGLPLIQTSHDGRPWPWIHDICNAAKSIVVAVSPAALRGVPEDRRADARVILNGVSPSRVRKSRSRSQMLADWGIPPDARVAGWLSRIAAEKRPEKFIDAVSLLPPEWHGVFVGTGMHEETARDYAARVAPGRIVFPGFTEAVGDVLAAFDAFILPTSSEANSLAIAEAMLAGCPIYTTRTGILEGDDAADLVRLLSNPPEGPSGREIADAILEDRGNPSAWVARVDRAQQFARTMLSMDRFGAEWTDLIVRSGGPPPSPDLVDCGHGVWMGKSRSCDDHGHRFDRVAHVYRDDIRQDVCRHVAAMNPDSFLIRYRGMDPVATMCPSLDDFAAFARLPGRLLVHCAGGATRSPLLALAALMARGRTFEDAQAAVIEAARRDRGVWPGWRDHGLATLKAWCPAAPPAPEQPPDPIPSPVARPSFGKMVRNFASSAIDHVRDGGRKATASEQASRREACFACPHHDHDRDSCSRCGCGTIGALSFVGINLPLKRSWSSNRCPDDPPRWVAT